MIYLNLAEALNLTCDQAIFFFFLAGKKKKSLIAGYAQSSVNLISFFFLQKNPDQNFFQICTRYLYNQLYAKVIFGDPGAVRRVGRSGAKIVFKPCLVTILKPLYCFLSAVGMTFIYFLSFKSESCMYCFTLVGCTDVIG